MPVSRYDRRTKEDCSNGEGAYGEVPTAWRISKKYLRELRASEPSRASMAEASWRLLEQALGSLLSWRSQQIKHENKTYYRRK